MNLVDKFGLTVLCLWAFGVLVSLAFVVGLVIVAVHFLTKLW